MVTVVIPTYNPDYKFYKLLSRLNKQTIDELEIVVIDSGSKELDFEKKSKYKNVKFTSIPNCEFDHGGTRNLGVKDSKSEFFIFMTQDAVPINKTFIAELLEPFLDCDVSAVYGRQVANKDASYLEKFTRNYNYPNTPIVKSKKDINALGIKTFFTTDVCCAYRAKDFFDFGRFPDKIITSEDMIMAFKFIMGDKKVVYNPKAMVFHSHNYSFVQQFKRNFDIGVSLKQNSQILHYAISEKEGVRFLTGALYYLTKNKKIYLIIFLLGESFFKLIGYRLGIIYNYIPVALRKKISMNASYWQ